MKSDDECLSRISYVFLIVFVTPEVQLKLIYDVQSIHSPWEQGAATCGSGASCCSFTDLFGKENKKKKKKN